MTVIIGIDPHKRSHTAVALGEDDQVLGDLRVVADAKQISLAAPALVVCVTEIVRRHRCWGAVVGLLAVVSVAVHGYGAVAGGLSAETTRAWEQIDVIVREQYGDLVLGETDLRG
jgi:hypothetical protein